MGQTFLDIRKKPYRTTTGNSGTTISILECNRKSGTYPITKRRKKPEDLFAGATARTVETFVWDEIQPHIIDVKYATGGSGWNTLYSEVPAYSQLSRTAAFQWSLSRDIANRLDNKIIDSVKGTSAQAMVDLIELRKTRDLCSTLIFESVDFLRGLRSGRTFRKLFLDLANPVDRGSKKLSNKWLEYQYGIAPTLASLADYHDVLSQKLQEGIWVYGRVKLRNRIATTARTEWSSSRPPYSTTIVVAREGYEYGKAHFRYKISDKTLKSISQYGLTNPLATAWELVPYSFVLDWFLDIGGYINRMDWALGISNLQVIKMTGCNVKGTLWTERSSGFRQGAMASSIYTKSVRTGPNATVSNAFMGVKKFTNEGRRLTSALALLNQLRR